MFRTDGNSILWSLLLQLILIMINAIFACAEIAVISIKGNKLAKLAEEGNKRAQRLLSPQNSLLAFLQQYRWV